MMSCLSCVKSLPRKAQGFSLIEMAIVMVIIGALLGGLLMPLSSQRELNKRKTAAQQLEDVRQALLGFVVINGFLPCPSTAASNGREARAAGVCSAVNGFVPYADLGVQGTVQNGLLVDAWQAPLRYSLTSVNSWEYAKAVAITGGATPNFTVCSASPCNAANTLAANVVAVVIATGKDGVNIPPTTSPDQLVNLNGGNDFISHGPVELAGSEFDDQLVWIAQPTLIYELSKVK